MMIRWIKKAVVSLLLQDTTPYPRTQVTYNGVAAEAYRFSPYGISSHPPLESLAVLLSPDGRRGDPVALIADPLNRFKELAEGEVQIGNHKTRSSVKFSADSGVQWLVTSGGDLVVTLEGGNASIDVTGDITIKASGGVTINGNLTVTGTITGQTDVIGGPTNVSLSTHTHNETGTGGGVTLPPNP